MKDLETKAVDILDKLDALTTQYAPNVIDNALQAVAATGISNIVSAIVGLIVAYLVWFATKKLTTFFVQRRAKDGCYSAWGAYCTMSYIVGGVICIILVIVNACSILDIWNWIAIFNPELAMAHRVLGL